MKPGDLVHLFSRVDTHVWCWDEDDNDYYLPNGALAVIIRLGFAVDSSDDPYIIDLILCDGKSLWVHRHQIEAINETG